LIKKKRDDLIITDESQLRIVCEPVLLEEVDELRLHLEKELEQSAQLGRPGIGLACPQIGIAKKMAIVRILTKGGIISLDLVNCEIIKKFDKFLFTEEGCLSFPDRLEKTWRYNEIVVDNNLVNPRKFVTTGLLAVCIQHELDHLNQILLPDVAIK
jgi:peptide deformylase